jgi:hypothetical protein
LSEPYAGEGQLLDPDVADVPSARDWYDLNKIWEIIEHTAGGKPQGVAHDAPPMGVGPAPTECLEDTGRS